MNNENLKDKLQDLKDAQDGLLNDLQSLVTACKDITQSISNLNERHADLVKELL